MPVSYTVNVGVDRGAHAMRLTYLPPECWHFFVPKERVLMMSMTSKEAREKMEKARAAVDLCLNMKFWFKERRSGENEKREALLEKVGDMAEKYQIESLVLMNFGMTHADFPRLGATLAKCKELKCLELAQNDFGIGLRGLIEIVCLTSLTTLNLKQVNRRSYLIEIVSEIDFTDDAEPEAGEQQELLHAESGGHCWLLPASGVPLSRREQPGADEDRGGCARD